MRKGDDPDPPDRTNQKAGPDPKPDLQPEPKPKPVPAPKLPAGEKLDLTHEKIAVDGVDFEIPKSIPAAGNRGEVRTATSLTPVEWLTVARNNRLLYGIDLERALSEAGGFEAEHAALVWQVPENDDFVQPIGESNSEASFVYSSRMMNFTRARIMNASLMASFPFVGATAEAGRAERHAESRVQKMLHMSGKWNYPRARLRLGFCTAIAPRLVTALEEALSRPDGASRFAALREVFASFGHAVPKDILIGGQMFFEMDQRVDVSVDASAVENTIKTAISLETTSGGGGGGIGFAVGNGKRAEAQDIARNTKWQCVGGDTTLDGSPSEWRETVKNPNLWSVIERDGVVALTDRLEAERPDLAARVRDTWEGRLRRFWAGHKVPTGYVLPPFGGEAFSMSRDGATNAPTVSAEPRKPMTKRMFETWVAGGDARFVAFVRHVVARIAELKPYLNELDASADRPSFGRLLADTQGMYDPAGRNCLWHLVYSGAVDGGGEPYFWIVQFDPERAESTLMAEPSPRPLAVVVDTNPLDNLSRPDFESEMKKELAADTRVPLPAEMWDRLWAALLRPRLGYVMSDRVLAEPPLRLDDEKGVLNGAFWTVEPVEGSGERYVFRSAAGFSFELAHPPGLKQGDEISVWRDRIERSVFCRTASARALLAAQPTD